MEPLRHVKNKRFGGVIFRRTSPQIRNEGALWDQSFKLYSLKGINAKPKESILEWEFPSGANMKFGHLEHEKNKLDWQGSEIPYIGFDELTHFSESQFIYMLSRNRSTCGVRPYTRGTCNPDSSSWVRKWIDWYINKDTGYPIPERSGVIRWFIRDGGEMQWASTSEELKEKFPGLMPLSFTFIMASVHDNKILMEADPGYLAKLQSLPLVEREQLLGGNWNITPGKGIILREQILFYRELPPVKSWSWTWDTAIKEGEENDYSVGQLWAECDNGYYLHFQWRKKVPYPDLKMAVKNYFEKQRARELLIEDKASGQQLVQDFRRSTKLPVIAMVPGRNMGKSKIERANFVSPLFEANKIFVREGQPWTQDVIEEWCAFPFAPHDDQVDPMTQYLSRKSRQSSGQDSDIGGPVTTGGSMSETNPFDISAASTSDQSEFDDSAYYNPWR